MLKIIFCLFLLGNNFIFSQNLFPTRDEKLKQLKSRNDIKVTEVEKRIYKLMFSDGHSTFKNTNDYQYPNDFSLKYSLNFDSTIIDLGTIDTSIYYQKYHFWREALVGSLDYEPMIGDINNNRMPEIYGQQYNADTSRIVVMEMNSDSNFNHLYEYDSALVVKPIYDINKDGGKELLLGSNSILEQYPGNSYLLYKKPSETSLATELSFIFYRFGGQQENNYFGDWDGDNYTDWIFVNLFWGNQSINIYEFNPLQNNFDSVYNYAIGNNPYGGFAIGDFDQDWKTEFLGGNMDGDVVSIENNGDNIYGVNWDGWVETYNAYMATQTNDLDGNGKEEIWIAGDAFYNGIPKTRITIFEAVGNNSYYAVGKIDLIGVFSFDAGNIQSADVDKDGKDEIMICIDANVIILKFAGSENHQFYDVYYIKQNISPGIYFYGATMYDFFNDGNEEIVISLQNYPNSGYRLLSDIYIPDTTTNIINEIPEIPDKYFLYQNYPNPFNPSTTIKFSISERSLVSLRVYNLLGKEINTLTEKEYSPGIYKLNWDVDSNDGILSSGVYFIKLSVNANGKQYTKTIKALLLK